MNLEQALIYIAELEAQVDSLMLEFCPDEMTEKQKERWAEHQRACHEEVIDEAYRDHTGGFA